MNHTDYEEAMVQRVRDARIAQQKNEAWDEFLAILEIEYNKDLNNNFNIDPNYPDDLDHGTCCSPRIPH